MKQKILLILTIVSVILIVLYWVFGIVHKYSIINILVLVSFIIIVALNFKSMKLIKNKIIKIIHIILAIILALLIVYTVFLTSTLIFLGGKTTTIDKYTFPNNKKESLKNVYYADIMPISPPIQVVYEKKIIFGIKCSIKIKSNVENAETFNLEEIYKEIDNKNNGFCNHKLKIE